MQKERNKTLDCFKGVLIILVCIRHILQHNVSDEGGVLTNVIWAIQMPGFMLISGYFARRTIHSSKELGNVIIKKIISYILPFFSWFILVTVLLLGNFSRNLVTAFNHFQYHIDGGLWFLWVVGVLSVVFSIVNYWLSKSITNPKKRVYIMTTLVIIYGLLVLLGGVFGLKFWGIQYILYYSLYYMTGFAIRHFESKLSVLYSNRIRQVLTFACLIIYFTIIFNYDLYRSDDSLTSIFMRVLSAYSGLLLLFELVRNGHTRLEVMKIDWIGKYTLEIYATHVYLINLLNNNNTLGNAPTFFCIDGMLNFIWASFLMTIFTYLIIVAIKSSAYSDLLFFGKRKAR